MRLSFFQIVRVEIRGADWRSLLHSVLAAMLFAAVAAGRAPGMATQHAPLRFGFLSLSTGVLLALENDDGEAGAAFRVGPGFRMFARLASVGLVWAVSLAVIVEVSHIPSVYVARLATEAAVMMTVAVLIAGFGIRLWDPGYSIRGAMVLVVAFLVSWLLPDDVNPWWTGIEEEPSKAGWYLAGSLCAVAVYLTTRRANLVEFPLLRRMRLVLRRGPSTSPDSTEVTRVGQEIYRGDGNNS